MASLFGSSSDMIIQPVVENGVEMLLAIDEKGLYLTTTKYVDKNLADPNRYTGARANIQARLAALDIDAAAVAAANQDKVKKFGEGEAKKKVNPLKASKRAMRG